MVNTGIVSAERVRRPWWQPEWISLSIAIPLLLLLIGAIIGAFAQVQIEYPIMRFLNSFADRLQLFDRSMHALTKLVLLQGAVFIALVWYLWFTFPDIISRSLLLAGTLGAALAGAMSRVMQLLLPSHLRPLHTPQLGFVLPLDVDPRALNHFSSFPSDHGAVFFGLSAIIYRINPKLGIAAFAWAVVIDVARVYEGYHFPSDIIGAAGIGLLMVQLSQVQPVQQLASRCLMLERSFRPAFYMVAFLATYQIASLFDDVRELGTGLLHHGPLIGG
jgi:membrane-associated phospholipid phosphatase